MDGHRTFYGGWKKEIIVRKGGASAGGLDVYIYSPKGGAKLRSRPDLLDHLNKNPELLGETDDRVIDTVIYVSAIPLR